jgi:hypothetical protein
MGYVPGVKQSGREADQLPPFRAEVNNGRAIYFIYYEEEGA